MATKPISDFRPGEFYKLAGRICKIEAIYTDISEGDRNILVLVGDQFDYRTFSDRTLYQFQPKNSK